MKSATLSMLLCMSVLSPGQEQGGTMDSQDPSETYFRSYIAAGVAESLEKAGDFKGAAEKIAEATLLIERIRKDHPEWKTEMVVRRFEANTVIVERLRPRAEAILVGVGDTPTPQPEKEATPPPPRPRPKRIPLRQISTNWEDSLLTDEYFEKRSLFDSLLRMKTRQDQVQLLCSQFGKAVERMDKERGETSPLLKRSMAHESQRLPLVSRDYMVDRLKFARVRLSKDWMDASSYQQAVNDFRVVFGQNLKEIAGERPDLLPEFGEKTDFFRKPYLCPIDQFTQQFRSIKGFRSRNSRTSIGVPGFPKMSFYYYAFDGDFTAWGGPGGTFNRMMVITDSWDQVVGLQFTCEAPKELIKGNDAGIGVYNFVQFRRKGTPSYRVIHQTDDINGSLRIATMLRSGENTPKEINVLYLPKPTAMLLIYCLSPK